jgi:hypothetical protein
VCDLLRARVAAAKFAVVLTSACVRIYLIHLTFVKSQNPDTHCNWRSVWFSTRTSHCRERFGGVQTCICEGCTHWSHICRKSWHTLIRSSVRFTTCTSQCREIHGGAQKCVCEDLTHWSDICRESWQPPYEELCVICYAHESLSRKPRSCSEVHAWEFNYVTWHL